MKRCEHGKLLCGSHKDDNRCKAPAAQGVMYCAYHYALALERVRSVTLKPQLQAEAAVDLERFWEQT